METKIKKAGKALEQAEIAKLKKENRGIVAHKNYENSYIKNLKPT